ncbi:putative short-chain dehydrogenase [Pestalotiopsis sp. NC0098]|nr:putative short-chain dehydrogenase [Pestalotiopsis sp. NC0098]
MATSFNISPEKEATFSQFLYRQFLVKPSAVQPENVDLQGKTAIVTGSNGGIGLECCRQLLRLGLSRLVMAVRDEQKGHDAMQQLYSSEGKNRAIEVWQLDLESYASISAFSQRTTSLDRIDYVILNAGITRPTFHLNPSTGHEDNIQINYLSNVLLTILLLPVLKSKRSVQQQPSRVVFVSSDAAPWTDFPEQDAQPLLPAFDVPGTMNMTNRYYTSKLLQQFFVAELGKRIPASVAVITASTPGLVYGTNALKELPGLGGRIQRGLVHIIGYSPEVGARQLVDAAVNHGDETHGQYLCSQKLKP